MKSLFLLWCLAPVDHNGSDLIFDNLLAPLYHLTMASWAEVRDQTLSCLVYLLDDVLQPLYLHLLPLVHCILSSLCNCPQYFFQNLQSALSASQDWILGAIDWLSAAAVEVINVLVDPFTVFQYYASVPIGIIESSYNKIKLYYYHNEENPIYFSKLFKTYRRMFLSEFLSLIDVLWQSMKIITEPLTAQFNSNVGHFYRKIGEAYDNCSQIFSFVSTFRNSLSDWIFSFPATFQLYFHEMSFVTRFISYVLDSLSNCANFTLKYFMMCYEVFVNVVLYLQKSTFFHIYKKHDKQPRLFSQVFKEMIKQMK